MPELDPTPKTANSPDRTGMKKPQTPPPATVESTTPPSEKALAKALTYERPAPKAINPKP